MDNPRIRIYLEGDLDPHYVDRTEIEALIAAQSPSFIGIVGSREYPDTKAVRSLVAQLPSYTIVCSGGARGVDVIAATAARERGLHVIEFLADWAGHGRGAGFRRNTQLVEFLQQKDGRLIAFGLVKEGAITAGTRHTIQIANDRGVPVTIFTAGASP